MKNKKSNVIYMRGSDEARVNNIKAEKHRKNRKLYIRLSMVLLAGIILLVFLIASSWHYKAYIVLESNESEYESTVQYLQFDEKLLRYTTDRVSYINENGKSAWTAVINMKKPIAVSSGKYAVLADIGGNQVSIFATGGQVNTVTMPYTICDVDVADQGAFAVVLESDETNYINLYDKDGNIIYEMQTTINKSGYPLDISISDDAQKLVTSYIGIGGSGIENNVSVYNFGDVGQNSNADRMVGGYTFEDEIITKVEFIDNDTVAAFGTKTIELYSVKEKPSLRATIELDGEARSVFYSEKYIGIIENYEKTEEETTYQMIVYDKKGKKKFSKLIDFDYSYINAGEKEIIVAGEAQCIIVRANGQDKFEGSLGGTVKCVVPNGNKNEYIVSYDTSTDTIKLSSGLKAKLKDADNDEDGTTDTAKFNENRPDAVDKNTADAASNSDVAK